MKKILNLCKSIKPTIQFIRIFKAFIQSDL